MRMLWFLIFLLPPLLLSAQSDNLLSNPGFEESDSSGRVKDWYLPMSSNYHHDKEGRYGPSHSGAYKAGICISNYRFSEAMQTLLKDTLQKGVQYQIRFYARAQPRTEDCYNYFAADEIQIYFPEKPVPSLPVKPYPVSEKRLIRLELSGLDSSQRKQWQLFEATYTAVGGEWVMAVGYFMRKDNSKPLTIKAMDDETNGKDRKKINRKKETNTEHPIGTYYRNADEAFRVRYYFDDFELRAKNPSEPAVAITQRVPHAGSHWVFHNILFHFDRSDLMPSALPVLDSLAQVLKNYPDMQVEILAYTDSIGSDKYNLELSEKRARAVMQYLVGEGIDPKRLRAIGKGESEAIGNNGTEKGRALNRRVEFLFLQK